MDGDLNKEQIDTLFVRVGLLQGGFWGGWVVQRGSHPFFEGCSTTFFCLPSCVCPPKSFGASNYWARRMRDAVGDSQNGTELKILYTLQDFFSS